VQRAARAARGANGSPHRARVRLPDGSWYPRDGSVDFTDSTIDQRTGTVTARAVFPNPERALVPGQFVRVRVALDELTDVLVIDETAVGEGPAGPQVFVIDAEQVAHARPVRLGPVVDAGQVILEGLQAGDRLVVNGQVALRDGTPVTVLPAGGER
jgi:membrane fusion protein (multidrug efflux system)